MKTRMRVLSILVCLALLMSAAPADLRLAAGFATEAEGEIETAVNEPAPIEEAEPEPEPIAPELVEEPEGGDPSVEAPAEDASAGEDEAGPEENSEADPQAGGEDAGANEAPDEAEGEAAVDYAADASASPAFAEGYAELVRDGAILYADETAEAEAKAELGKGVVYATARSDAQEGPDRLKVSFNAERGVDTGWVDASTLRPMEPEAEVPAYIEFCKDRENVIYSDELAGLPLARISCAYPEEQIEDQTEVGSEDADAEDVHPVIDLTPVEDDVEPEPVEGEVVVEDAEAADYDVSTMPMPLDDPLFQLEDVLAAIGQDSIELREGDAQQLDLELSGDVEPVLTSSDESVATVSEDGMVTAVAPGEALITMTAGDLIDVCSITVTEGNVTLTVQADTLYMGAGETYSLVEKGFVTCTADNADDEARINLLFDLLEEGAVDGEGAEIEASEILDVSGSGVILAKKAGSAKIQVTDQSTSANQTFTVVVRDVAKSVSIPASLTLGVGMSAKLDIAFSPANTYSSYTLTSSNEGVAAVDPVTGIVEAKSQGYATITIDMGGCVDTCLVNVITQPGVIVLKENPIVLSLSEKDRRIVATAYETEPEEGEDYGTPIPCEFTYTVDEAGKEKVSVDENGVLTPLTFGTATVTVTIKGTSVSENCSVQVASDATSVSLREDIIDNMISLGVGDTFQISDGEGGILVLDPADSHVTSYEYISLDPDYAEVSDTGLIKAKKAGYADIEISAANMEDSLTLTVHVQKLANSISFDQSEIVLGPGESSAELTVSFLPANAYADYTVYVLGEEIDEEGISSAPIEYYQIDELTWGVSLKDGEEISDPVFLVAETKQGQHKDLCQVRQLPIPTDDDIEIVVPKLEDGGPLVLGMGETALISARFINDVAGEIYYESGDPKKVDVDIMTGEITAKSVTATEEDADATVPVYAKATMFADDDPDSRASASIEVKVVSYPTEFKLNHAELKLVVGDSYDLAEDPDQLLSIAGGQTSFIYEVTSGGSNGSVSPEGVITAKKAGTMKVRITPVSGASGVTSKTLTVTVQSAASSISLSEDYLRIGVGMKDRELSVSFPSKTYGHFTASSDNEAALTIERDGEKIKLTPVAPGKATVKVQTAKGCAASCVVEVLAAPSPVTLVGPDAIAPGEAGRSVSAVYDDSTSLADIIYISNNSNVLAVDRKTGALTAKKYLDGGVTISAYLNEYKGDGTDVAAATLKINLVQSPDQIFLQPASIELPVGETYQITYGEPGDMVDLTPNTSASFSFSSSDKSIATVSATGLVEAKKAGSAEIVIRTQNNKTKSLDVKVVKDFKLKSDRAKIGVGMTGKLTASGAPKGWTIEYRCEPREAADAVEFDPDTGEFTANEVPEGGVAFLVATATNEDDEDAKPKTSNAVKLEVLAAPDADDISFTDTSVDRVGPNQKNAYVTATCAEGTMAELRYELSAYSYDVEIDETTGKLTVSDFYSNGSVEVVAYDANNRSVSAKHVVALVDSAGIERLKTDKLYLYKGESYFVTDGPDGIIVLYGDDPAHDAYGAASYSFKHVSGTTGVVSWNASGLFTAKKAGSERVRITSKYDKSFKDLTFTVVKANNAAVISPSVLRLAEGMEGKLAPTSSRLKLESSAPEIATVDAWGNVKAVAAGKATVTATDLDGKIAASALVEVVERPTGISFAPGLQGDDGVLIMGKGETGVKLVAEIEAPKDGGAPVGTIEYALDYTDDELKAAKKYVTVNAKNGALTAKKVTYNSTDEEDYPINVIARVKEYPDVVSEQIAVSVVAKTAISLVAEGSDPEKPTALKSIKLGEGNSYQLGMFGDADEDDSGDYEEEEPAFEEEAVHHVIRLTPEGARAKLSYKSSKTSIVTVSADGLITAVAPGTTKVRVSTQSGRYADLSVQVCKLPDSAALSASSLRLGEKMSSKLKVSFVPANSYDNYTLTSSDPDIATVDEAGNVTAVASEGMAIITMRTQNGLTDSCLVQVVPGAGSFTVNALRGTRNITEEGVEAGLTMSVGESKVQLIPVPEEGDSAMAEFTFSLNKESETFKDDKKRLAVNATTGVLTASKKTVDPITVLVKDKNDPEAEPVEVSVTILAKPAKNTMELTQTKLMMGVGEEYQISDYNEDTGEGIIVMNEDDCRASYSYKSSKTAVATVSASGLIKAKSAGSATITIATQNANVYKKLKVTVSEKATGVSLPPSMKLGSNMTTTLKPTFVSAKAYGDMEAEVIPAGSDLTATVNSATGEIELAAGNITGKTSATLRVRLAGTEISDTCLVTLLPAPGAGGIEIDYANIPATEVWDGENVIVVSKNETGVKVVAKCVDPDAAMCDFVYSLGNSIYEGVKINEDTGALTIGYKEGGVKYNIDPGIYRDAIIATAKNGEENPAATAKATLVVVAVPEDIRFHVSDEKPAEKKYTLQMGKGETYQIAEYKKNEATGEEGGILVPWTSSGDACSASYSFSSSKSSVASVSSSGLITAKAKGNASITVTTQNGKSRSFTVNVVDAPKTVALEPANQEIGENSNGKVALTYPDGGCSLAKSYVSSDPDLLQIRPDGTFSTGLLANVGRSQDVTITVTTQNGMTAYATVTVLPHPTEIKFAQETYTLSVGMTAKTALAPFKLGEMAQKFQYALGADATGFVEIDPATGEITGVKATTSPVTITVTSNYDVGTAYQATGTAQVVVEPAPGYITYDYEGATLTQPLKLMKGDEITIPEPKAFEDSTMAKELHANFTYELADPLKDKNYLTITGNKMKAAKAHEGDIVVIASAHNSTGSNLVETKLRVRIYDEKPTGIELYFEGREVNGKTLNMYVNGAHPVDSIALSAKIISAKANYGEIIFESDNEKYVTVDANGVVTARGGADVPAGTKATITAKSKLHPSVAATCTIEVGKLCDSVRLEQTSYTLQEGEEKQITMVYTPADGTGMRFSYASNKPDVVTVDASGMLKAVGGGTATITVTGQYDMLTPNTVTVDVLYNPDSIKLPVRKLYMKPGQTVELTPELSRTVGGSEIDAMKVNQYTTYTSDTESDAAVRIATKTEMDQANGTAATYLVTAVLAGSRTFTFKTYNGLEFACEIVVKNELTADLNCFGWEKGTALYLVVGDTAELEYGLTVVDGEAGAPGTISDFSLTSGSAEILSVQGSEIKGEKAGDATLTLTVNDTVADTVTIHVIEPVIPQLYYGDGFTQLIQPQHSEDQPDVTLYTDDPSLKDYGNHEIKIDPLPGNKYDKNGVLLGTFEVDQSPDESLLLFDRNNLILRATAKAGMTSVTVRTFGSETEILVKVISGAPTYRALLISEYDGAGDSNGQALPFSGPNVALMKSTLEKSNSDGANYKGNIVTSKNPNRNKIASLITSTFGEAKESDVSLIYVCAHGHSNNDKSYHFSGTGGIDVTSSNIINWISQIEGRIVLILDSCHSGAFITDLKSKKPANADSIAVLAAQEGPRAAAYYQKYKKIDTFEFFTRAIVTALGYPQNVELGSTAEPWKGKNDNAGNSADSDKNGKITLKELGEKTKPLTKEMVNAYADPSYGKPAGTAWWNAGNGGLMVGGISANGTSMKSWFDQGRQVPRYEIPSGMESLEIFSK